MLLHVSFFCVQNSRYPHPLHAVVRCFTLASIPNGAITYGPDMIPDYDVGTVATHSCNPGFRLLGSETRECLASGIWSGLIPVCLRYVYI